ncbi:hypothetical protein K438DRAFT_1838762 [Mycena galopus ATCC 62051]|nr:hypothetical protein K438DRAFT_1838762 [Mycena galopus ATCC 62051]
MPVLLSFFVAALSAPLVSAWGYTVRSQRLHNFLANLPLESDGTEEMSDLFDHILPQTECWRPRHLSSELCYSPNKNTALHNRIGGTLYYLIAPQLYHVS